MRFSKFALIICIVLTFCFLFSLVWAGQIQSRAIWLVQTTTLTLTFNAPTFCVNYNGSNLDINITVIKNPNNTFDPDANVTANVIKPNGDTNFVYFSSNGDGNHSINYTFDLNGIYDFQLHGVDGFATGDLNARVYVGDVGMTVSFLNNGQTFTSGTTQTTTTQVRSGDGNAFVGVSGVLSINYPSGSSFVSSAAMSSIGSGQYTYTFTVPAQEGTYTETAVFSCGLNSDTNSQGFFIVPTTGGGTPEPGPGPGDGGGGGGGGGPRPECGNLICEIGESAKTCFVDCAASAGPDGTIVDWKFENDLQIGSPSGILVDVQNTGNVKNDYILTVLIRQGRDIEFEYEEALTGVEIGETRNLVLSEKWTPLLGGSHIIILSLYSANRDSKFDEIIHVFDLAGNFRYDVIVECLKPFIKLGSQMDANITYWNMGDYFEDVDVSYWVEDFEGRIFGKTALPIALFPNEPQSFLGSVFIGQTAKPGQYNFWAKVIHNQLIKESFCSFSVEREESYYLKVIEMLEEDLNNALKCIEDKKNARLDVSALEIKYLSIKEALDLLKQKFLLGNFTNADEELDVLRARIIDLSTECNAVFQPMFMLNLFFIFLLLLLLILLILFLIWKRRKKKEDRDTFIDWLLGLTEKKYSKPFKGKSIIDKLLGIK